MCDDGMGAGEGTNAFGKRGEPSSIDRKKSLIAFLLVCIISGFFLCTWAPEERYNWNGIVSIVLGSDGQMRRERVQD